MVQGANREEEEEDEVKKKEEEEEMTGQQQENMCHSCQSAPISCWPENRSRIYTVSLALH